MTEATARELRERVSRLEYELATIRGACPEGVRPVDFLRHLIQENKDLREQRSRNIYDSPYQEA